MDQKDKMTAGTCTTLLQEPAPERVKRVAVFQPRMPKGKRGRHNEAKVAAKAAMEERTPIGRSRRRKFNHRIQKQMKEVTCCREKQRHEVSGMYCVDATFLPKIMPRRTYLLKSLTTMVEPSTTDPNKGIWMWGKEANGEDTFLCTRIPMRRTAELFKHHQGWQETIRKALGVKPCVKRGAARNGMSRSYI